MHIVSNIYLVLDDLETFLKSGLFDLLADGIKVNITVMKVN